jgi:hypothetical protein
MNTLRGKRIGSAIYVHRLYAAALEAVHHLLPALSWDYVKFDRVSRSLVFTKCDDWDATEEPIVTFSGTGCSWESLGAAQTI